MYSLMSTKRNEIFLDKKIVLIIFAVIVFAGFLLRFYNLSWETYSYGEVEVKQAADEYVKGNFVNNYYIFDTPPVGKYMFAVSMFILGDSEFAMRIVSLIFGMITIISVFYVAQRVYDIKISILATVITAFSILQIQFSRYAQLETMLSFFYVLIFYFSWKVFNNPGKYTAYLLGISLGLSIAVKFTSVIILVAIIIYAIYAKHIKFSRKSEFFLSIKGWIFKVLLFSLIVLLVSWPFGLLSLHTTADISVDYGNVTRVQNVDTNIPIILLSFGRRIFSSVESDVAYPLAMKIPVANYLLLYLTKEILLITIFFILGLYFMLKHPLKPDKLILIIIVTFLILLSFQRTSVSYRHIVPMVPFFSIIASRWITKVKNFKHMAIIILVISVILFSYAALSGPSYTLSDNQLKNTLGISDSEARFSEGMKETINYIQENCTGVYAGDYYRFMIEPYYKNVSSSSDFSADCVIKGNIKEKDEVKSYIENKNCTVSRTITKNSIELIKIYSC